MPLEGEKGVLRGGKGVADMVDREREGGREVMGKWRNGEAGRENLSSQGEAESMIGFHLSDPLTHTHTMSSKEELEEIK